jgi:bifunctional oligoribonuclease and PAP phosphatase NrnA
MDSQIQEIKQLLSVPKYISILSHRNPDGDAIGSSLGLYHYLNQLGHTVRVVLPSDYPLAFEWMPDVEDITIFDTTPERSREIVNKSDMIFCLDFNSLDRIDKLGETVHFKRVPKVLIDHHLDPEDFTDFLISDTSASSTCELVYQFICDLGDKNMITPNVAESLYTGMMTDTGSFKYATNPRLFRQCADLKERGLDDYRIQDSIFNSLTEKQLRLLGHALANRMEVMPDLPVAIIHLTKQDYVDFDIQRGDTEGIVNQMLMMRKIKVACFITEQPTIVKISMRSKGDFSVQEICQKYFNGGGHKNASGGYLHQNLTVAMRKLKEALPLYRDKLT